MKKELNINLNDAEGIKMITMDKANQIAKSAIGMQTTFRSFIPRCGVPDVMIHGLIEKCHVKAIRSTGAIYSILVNGQRYTTKKLPV